MKKLILILAATLVSAATISAQTVAEATECYNQAAQYLDGGDYANAVSYFKQALATAEKCETGADEVIANCKSTIAKVQFEIAKSYLRDKNFDNAIAQYAVAKADAQLYGDDEVVANVDEVLPKAYLQKALALQGSKDFAGSIEAAKKVLELEPDNGTAALVLGKSCLSAGKTADAEAAFKLAKANGKEKDADKQLSTLYLKKAQAALKAGKLDEVIKQATLSNECVENANAYKLCASASQKLGKTQDMIAYYEKYLAISPNAKDAAGVNYTIAVTYQQAGNKAEAVKYYQKVVGDPTYGAQAQQQISALGN
ncbi:MAG: tetratricopeptide repeat protein [Bacteroidales bacterium]|nr:tetratricopeptide repeat protein [Bacteroidales bacterium]